MSITKYKDSKGRTRYRVQENVGTKWNGKPDRPSKVCDTLKAARKVQAAFDATKLRNQGKAYGMNFKEFVETVFLPAKSGLTYDTLRAYKRDINLRLIPAFGHLDIVAINYLKIQQAISLCPTKKTATNMRETLRTILNMAVQLQVITSNPAKGDYNYPKTIKSHSEATKDNGWLNTFAEHRKVLEAAQGCIVEPILLLGLCSGLRKGEILAMEWEDIDFEKHQLTVRQTYVHVDGGSGLQPPKTERSCRTVPLTDYEEQRLTALKMQSKIKAIKGGTPIVTFMGKRMSSRRANSVVDDFFKARSDLQRLTILNMRHSFATACIRAKIDVSIVSRWLGHTNITTTYNRYVKPILKDLQEDVAIINNAFAAAG